MHTLFTSVLFAIAAAIGGDWAEARELTCRPTNPLAHASQYGTLKKLHVTYNSEAMLMGERVLPNGSTTIRDYGSGAVVLRRTLPPSLKGRWEFAKMSVWPKDGHDPGSPQPQYSWEGAFLLEGRFAYDVECTDPYVRSMRRRN